MCDGAGLDAIIAASATEETSSPASINPARWANAGGWYRVDASIRYRPVQHADSFLRAWATLEARTGDQDPDSAQVFAQIFSIDSPGACASCHVAPSAIAVPFLDARDGFIENHLTGDK